MNYMPFLWIAVIVISVFAEAMTATLVAIWFMPSAIVAAKAGAAESARSITAKRTDKIFFIFVFSLNFLQIYSTLYNVIYFYRKVNIVLIKNPCSL